MNDVPVNRILIVDDDRFMRITIKTILRAVGRFVIEEAADGADALGKLAGFRPDLVLCDIAMAPMAGRSPSSACAVMPMRHSAESVLTLTAEASHATIASAAGLQLSGYLFKPVSPNQVAGLFRTIFNLPDSAARAD